MKRPFRSLQLLINTLRLHQVLVLHVLLRLRILSASG